MTAGLSDDALRRLIVEDSVRGWRTFVDQYTPTLLALIERAGLADRDAIAEVYVRVCSRLAENDCARLRRYDPARGALAAWLTIVVRHVVVDWVRSEKGRPRLFRAVRDLSSFDTRVFELHYWDSRRPSEMVEIITRETNAAISLGEVFDALERIHTVLSDRQQSQLAALTARTSAEIALDDLTVEPADATRRPATNPEAALHATEVEGRLAAALARLPAEDAAIIRLLFIHGWTTNEIRRALRLADLSRDRIRRILEALRSHLTADGITSAERIS